MALDKRKNFKKMDPDQQQRFIKSIIWMKAHDKAGAESATGGSYQQYVEWHRDMNPVIFKDIFDFTASTTGTLVATDHFISIKIDGKVFTPATYKMMSAPGLIAEFLNGLYAQNMPGNPELGKFSVIESGGIVTVTCTKGVYEPSEFICEISGVKKTFTFTKSSKVGDLTFSNMMVAHSGALFLPWHRAFIRLFERDLQTADEQRLVSELGSAPKKDEYIAKYEKLALPYWDWAVDSSNDSKSPKGYLWQETLLGGDGNEVNATEKDRLETGPFKYSDWKLYGPLPNYLQRRIGRQGASPPRALATVEDVEFLNKRKVYDVYPFDTKSPDTSFRNVLEGWFDIPGNTTRQRGEMHNGVHMWVGGTMANVPIAPNDPIFYLNHCNVDRLWAEWQRDNKGAEQYPVFGPVPGRRKTDEMIPWISGSAIGAIRAADVLKRRPFPANIQPILGEGYKYDIEI